MVNVEQSLKLRFVDLASSDLKATAIGIRQACLDYGFFYLVNHGIEEEMLKQVFEQSKKFFLLPLQEKLAMIRNKGHRGYTPLYDEILDTLIESKGDLKESFYIGPKEARATLNEPNQWPSEEVLPYWRETMEAYYEKVVNVGRRLLSLIALALNLEQDFFQQVGALNKPMAFVRLIHYPGEFADSEDVTYGASAHSDYGLVTLLVTDGVRGLQICREKDKQPQVWEDVPHAEGAFIVNIGDILERWTNCLFRSTLHRVIATGQERYSVALFWIRIPIAWSIA